MEPIEPGYINVAPENQDLYREHIVHYFDNQMNRDIMMLAQPDKEAMFQMFKDYAWVLEKIFHPGIPIIEHVLEKRWEAAKANPHPGIDYAHQCPIIQEYDQWQAKKLEDEAAQS